MDLNDIWQENKRFISTVGAGLLVFLIGWMVVDGLYVGDIKQVQRSNVKARGKLNDPMYNADDRELARDENDELLRRHETVAAAAEFRPRPGVRLEESTESAKNTYISAVEAARERVRDLAARKRAFLPEGLDLDVVNTNNVDAIERNLHAVDLLERAVVMALDSGVKQVRGAEVKLDPAFKSRRGLGAIEKTQVTLDVVSSSEAVTRWIAMAETPADGGPETSVRLQALPIESIDMRRAASKSNEVRTRVTFLVVRVNEIEDPDAEDA